MKVKMFIAVAASSLLATSVAFAAAEPNAMQPADIGPLAQAQQQAPETTENIGATPSDQMLSDNTNLSNNASPNDLGASDDIIADSATGDDY